MVTSCKCQRQAAGILICFSVVCRLVASVCPGDEWLAYENSCYDIVVNSRASRADATDFCRARSSFLVSPSSREENSFLDSAVETKCRGQSCPDSVWLGMTHPRPSSESKSGWVWDDGSTYGWYNWYKRIFKDEPNDGTGCAGMWRDGGTWGDFRCDYRFLVVCEREEEKETSAQPTTAPVRISSTTTSVSTPSSTSFEGSDTSVTDQSGLHQTTEHNISGVPSAGRLKPQKSFSTTESPERAVSEDVGVYIGIGVAALCLVVILSALIIIISKRRKRTLKLHSDILMDSVGSDIRPDQTGLPSSSGAAAENNYIIEDYDADDDEFRAGVRKSSTYLTMSPSERSLASSCISPHHSLSTASHYDYVRTPYRPSFSEPLGSLSNGGSRLLEAEFELELGDAGYVGSGDDDLKTIYSLAKKTSMTESSLSPTSVYENVSPPSSAYQFAGTADRGNNVGSNLADSLPTSRVVYENCSIEHVYDEPAALSKSSKKVDKAGDLQTNQSDIIIYDEPAAIKTDCISFVDIEQNAEASNDEASNEENSDDEASNDGASSDETSSDETSSDESSSVETSSGDSSSDETSSDETSNDKASNEEASNDEAHGDSR